MLTTVIAYALIAFFFLAVESRRGSQSARTFHTSRFDRGSQRVLALGIVAVEAGLIAGPVLTYLGIGRLAYGWIVGWAGVALMVGGIALRYGAGKTLGVFYTRTLRVQPDQHIATDGPYRIIRHPGYAGTLLLWVGALCATANCPPSSWRRPLSSVRTSTAYTTRRRCSSRNSANNTRPTGLTPGG